MEKTTGKGHPGSLICVLGMAICLMGCQTQVSKAPPLPPPLPPAAAAPIPRPVRPVYYVNINQLSLRACPGTDCRRIATLELNTEVEKMGEIKNWAQVKVRNDGTMGYVVSRHLSPQRVEVAQLGKKKNKKTKPRKTVQPNETARQEVEAVPQVQEPAPPLPKAM